MSPSQCRSRWNYSPQRSTEKASIWYLSCLLWKTNYKWHSCLAEPVLRTRSAKQAQRNRTNCSSGASHDFQGNRVLQEGYSHPAGHFCKRRSSGHFSFLVPREGAVFCVPASLVRRRTGTRAEGAATSHGRKAQLQVSLFQPCQWDLHSGPQPDLQQHKRARQPQPGSMAKLCTFSTSKCTSDYNTVSNGSLHSFEMTDPEAITYGYWNGAEGRASNSHPIQPLPEQCSFKKWGLLVN